MNTGKYILSVTSSDELAFLQCMDYFNFNFVERKADQITIQLGSPDKQKTFRIVETMPFDPYRKKMSIVVKTED
jgi:magnesium-transporting ATPase (P-type)